MKTIRTMGMFMVIVAMASPALGSTRHVNCDVPGQTITKALKTAQPGDTIRVLPSTRPLDGGIQLKDNQRLIGLGDPVTKSAAGAAGAVITNTSSTQYDGDAIRLAASIDVKRKADSIDVAEFRAKLHAWDQIVAAVLAPV